MRHATGIIVRVAAIGVLLAAAGCWHPPGGGGEPPITYTISGTISGLDGSITLQDNGGDDLPISSDGPFTFATPVVAGGAYDVTVASQPDGQTCTVADGSGTANADVTGVLVTCTDDPPAEYTIAGSVSALQQSGLTMQNNASDNLEVPALATTFAFSTPVSAGSSYNVTILSQPAAQTCFVVNGSGIALADVTNVQVVCAFAI